MIDYVMKMTAKKHGQYGLVERFVVVLLCAVACLFICFLNVGCYLVSMQIYIPCPSLFVCLVILS